MSSDDSKAIYFISVASTLSGIHQQTIRTYEQKGLIKPFRTGGGTRRYSQEDIDKLIQIQNLSQRGINLDEIDRMIKDAEQHANEDAKKKELIETRNMAEGMVTSTEKMLDENKDKATEEEVQSITEAADKLKKLLENEELPINDLKLGIEELSKASQSFAEKLYADTQDDSNSESTNETDDVVEGEVIEDE